MRLPEESRLVDKDIKQEHQCTGNDRGLRIEEIACGTEYQSYRKQLIHHVPDIDTNGSESKEHSRDGGQHKEQ
jgi:hypothetical protein